MFKEGVLVELCACLLFGLVCLFGLFILLLYFDYNKSTIVSVLLLFVCLLLFFVSSFLVFVFFFFFFCLLIINKDSVAFFLQKRK